MFIFSDNVDSSTNLTAMKAYQMIVHRGCKHSFAFDNENKMAFG
jgi:hypothetical protein